MTHLPAELVKVIQAEYRDIPRIIDLFSSFLRGTRYPWRFAGDLIELAKTQDAAWDLRCTAILMLEHQLLTFFDTTPSAAEAGVLLEKLGLISDTGAVRSAVLKEGYSTTDLAGFAVELYTRLARLNRIHHGICGLNTSPEALLDFIYVSRRECKLTLARYLFDPAEVAARILDHVRASTGLPKREDSDPGIPIAEFDRTLAARLRHDCRVLWVSGKTSSQVNSLVEYPLTTVILAIKPPGSDLEFEVKRAGMRGPHPLDVAYERTGKLVPAFHRLQGASCGYMLDWEAYSSDRFARIYRGAHGCDPPMSRVLGSYSISSVPGETGDVQIPGYFTYPQAFGAGFDDMRATLQKCVQAYEGGHPREDFSGEVGWTVRFLMQTVPNQAWLAGSSSFRLDRVADLLSPRGPEIYFHEGLRRDFSFADSRRLADEILEEILGVFHPPDPLPGTFAEYVDAAFACPANRAAADTAYLDSIQDIAVYWGTLLAAGGHTEGESFVPRNVGLKSRWENGRWRVRICFMDHDCLVAYGADGIFPKPDRPIDGMRKDEDWIRGDPTARGEFTCLREIYRVSPPLQVKAENLFRAKVGEAYAATRQAMLHSEPVRCLFERQYVRMLCLRDRLIQRFLAQTASGASIARWKKYAEKRLIGSRYPADKIPAFVGAVVRNRPVLESYSFLFGTAGRKADFKRS